MMKKILLLFPCLPDPAGAPMQVRAWYMLQYLSEKYQVYLGCFSEAAADTSHQDQIKNRTAAVRFIILKDALARWQCVTSFFSALPLTLSYYRHAEMQQWVTDTVAQQQIQRMLVMGSGMAQYISRYHQSRRLIDMVELDSEKWMRLTDQAGLLMRWVYQFESRRLYQYEQQIGRMVDGVLFASQETATIFAREGRLPPDKVAVFGNGVDSDFFSDAFSGPNPFQGDACPLVVIASRLQPQEVEIIQMLAADILSMLHKNYPEVSLHLVVRQMDRTIESLRRYAGVSVHHPVDDVRPYLANAALVIAPFTQTPTFANPVLKAMSMARPVLASAQAVDGLNLEHRTHLLISRSSEQLFFDIQDFLQQPDTQMGQRARQYVQQHGDWKQHLSVLGPLL